MKPQNAAVRVVLKDAGFLIAAGAVAEQQPETGFAGVVLRDLFVQLLD
ncbi:MAG TPA: hypothetical protein VG651_08530 [Stellaceae bacterium]|nr:hypothetical protein [Stellaceae bacterium]